MHKEYLQELADRQQMATIRFKDVEGAVSEIRARIVKFESVGDRDIIETDGSISVGVDQIISVNDRAFSDMA